MDALDYQSDAAELQNRMDDLGFKVEFENEELEYKSKLINPGQASFFRDNVAEILVTVGALLLVVAIAFFGYTYYTRRRHERGYQQGRGSDQS